MANFKYFDQLKIENQKNQFLLEVLKMELDQRLYHYGANFVNVFEERRYKDQLLYSLWYFYKYFYYIYFKQPKDSTNSTRILSSSYFNLNKRLEQNGFCVYNPPHMINNNRVLKSWHLAKESHSILNVLKSSSFNKLLSHSTFNKINDFIGLYSEIVTEKQVDALILSNDETAINKIAIEAFKQISKPSFIFLHGLPGVYNCTDNNRTDYLIVWGEKIKENFVNAGIESKKIFVAGHPFFEAKNKNSSLRFSFENILVTTKVLGGSQHSDEIRLTDRGNLIYYLNSIQYVLQKFDIKSVRLRPHPSENTIWFKDFIDTNFFKFDLLPVKESLLQSSLVIGPTSSLLIESCYLNVNYVVFEPLSNGITLDGTAPAPPFDSSDSRIPVASNLTDLEYILKNKVTIDFSFIEDYIQPAFDISFLKKLI